MSGQQEQQATPARTARRKVRVGKVVSDRMQKSIIVSIERRVPHPIYKKYFRRTTRLKAHDESGVTHAGNTEKIMETRPLSKTKRWRLVAVLEKAK